MQAHTCAQDEHVAAREQHEDDARGKRAPPLAQVAHEAMELVNRGIVAYSGIGEG